MPGHRAPLPRNLFRKEKVKIVFRQTSEITPYANNPRRNDAAVAKVAESIRQYGFQQPIVVDKHSVVIVGHTRLLAAQSLGLKEVPVIVASKLTKRQAQAYCAGLS